MGRKTIKRKRVQRIASFRELGVVGRFGWGYEFKSKPGYWKVQWDGSSTLRSVLVSHLRILDEPTDE